VSRHHTHRVIRNDVDTLWTHWAWLGPLPGRAQVEEGVAGGWITPASTTGLGATSRWKSAERVLEALADDRSE
jgi:hypothetical protein